MNTKEVKTKKCSRCGKELPIDNFYRDNRTKDGLYCDCKECHSKITKKYIKANRDIVNQYQKQYNKQYQKHFKGYYLYIIQDKNNEIVYVGQTSNYYKRLCNHISGYVNATKELFNSGNWSYIKYLDVSFVENDLELKALENELIELYQPRCNTKLNIIHDIDRGRLFSLLAQLHCILNDWKVFRVNK